VGLEGAKEGRATGLLGCDLGETMKAAGAQGRKEQLCERYENELWVVSGTNVGQPFSLYLKECQKRTTPVSSSGFESTGAATRQPLGGNKE
jgi:hypothetical protein